MSKEVKKQAKKGPKQGLVKPGYILSIISVATSVLGIGFILGIPGLVMSIIGRNRATDSAIKHKGTKGMIMSIVGMAIGMIMSIVWAIGLFILIWKFIIW